MSSWRKILGRGAALLATVYAAVVGGLALNQKALVYHPHKEVVAPDLDGVEAVRIDTADGESLVAWWRPPPEGAPVILFFDGNGGQPHVWNNRWRRIIDGGAGFLAVYYRGYSGSTGAPSEKGLKLDAEAGYDFLVERGFAPEDIVIHGFSLGSGVAVKLAAERPARALVLEAPFASVAENGRRLFPFVPDFLISERFDSERLIGEARMPLLIAHGDADTVIPFSQGERLFARANEQKVLIRMNGSDHSTLPRDGLYDHIWRFLAETASVADRPAL